MKQITVTLLDYGRGNLFSVQQALEKCGASVKVTSDSSEILAATHLVLPGVGAFADGMLGLRELNLVDPIRTFAASGRPFLGVCLGMQMMLDSGFEFGEHKGLGLIPGVVSKISAVDSLGQLQKIPHIGWNQLSAGNLNKDSWENSILAGITPSSSLYFVHSFEAIPANAESTLAYCNYGGRKISAVIRSENMFGCQFHPEKSGTEGLKILRNFVNLK